MEVEKRFRTVGDFVYVKMKEWIFDQRLKPGEKIDQEKVADTLGVSKMPVRTSLEKLQAQGLVRIFPHRGAVVSELSCSELDEISLMREALEGLATREAVERMEDEDLRAIEKVLIVKEEQFCGHRWEEYLETNREFHMRIYKVSGREILLHTITALWDLYERYRRLYLGDIDRCRTHMDEHRQIWAAISERDAEKAASLVEEHTARSRKTLMALFEDKNDEDCEQFRGR
jgi:DNA-binding GntR family transcriptional regulator